MRFRTRFFSGQASAPQTLKRVCRLSALALFVLGFAPRPAAAQTPGITACPGTITTSVVLGGNITASQSPCITIGADNVTVNLANYSIDMTGVANPDTAVAIDAGAHANTTIESGTILTSYSTTAADTTAAIEASGGSNLNVNNITLTNEPSVTACVSQSRTNTNYGTGILLNGVTSGSIGSNKVTCYQTGISLQGSNVPRQGTGSIAGNTLTDDTYNMVTGGNAIYSGGLVLSNSSGWSVNNNDIEFTGSYDQSYGCSPVGNVLSCSFALQIINGSSDNTIDTNTVRNNFVGGIMTGTDTAKNSITGNTVLNNGLYDLYEEGRGHGNNFRNNTCQTVGGNLSQRACQ